MSVEGPKKDLKTILNKQKVAYAMKVMVINEKTSKVVIAKADQGFNNITVNPSLVKEMRMKEQPLKILGVKHITTSVASGDSTPLRIWVMFDVRVSGITRSVTYQ